MWTIPPIFPAKFIHKAMEFRVVKMDYCGGGPPIKKKKKPSSFPFNLCSWTQAGIFFVFAAGIDLVWKDHWASKECLLKWSQLLKINWVFLPIRSFALPPSLPLIHSSLWYGLSFEKRVRSTVSTSFQTNRVVMAVYPKYKSHYAQGS